jgi:hypothetical protein
MRTTPTLPTLKDISQKEDMHSFAISKKEEEIKGNKRKCTVVN